jgi:hypothetical protein
MFTDTKFRSNEPRSISAVFKMCCLKTTLVLAATVCGFWVAGSKNLLYWTHEMSGWFIGDNGPDVLHIVYETVKLAVRIAIAGYGSYGLLRRCTGV